MSIEGDIKEDKVEPVEALLDEDAPAEVPKTDAERIAELEVEVTELTDRHVRAVADLQNYRRRSEERWGERARAMLSDLIIRALPVLDDLDRALLSIDEGLADHQWVEGIRLVQLKFQEMLTNVGVQEIASEGTAFDPLIHEAVSFGPGAEGQVIVLVRAGYCIEDHVIRPAQVVVGDGSSVPD